MERSFSNRQRPVDNQIPASVSPRVSRPSAAAGNTGSAHNPLDFPTSTAITRQLANRASRSREQPLVESAQGTSPSSPGRSRFRSWLAALAVGLVCAGSALWLVQYSSHPFSQQLRAAMQGFSWREVQARLPSTAEMRDSAEQVLVAVRQRFNGAFEGVARAPTTEYQVTGNGAAANVGQSAADAKARYRDAARLLGLVAQIQPALADDPRLRSLRAEMLQAAERQETRTARARTGEVVREQMAP